MMYLSAASKFDFYVSVPYPLCTNAIYSIKSKFLYVESGSVYANTSV
jgi:hypothetical protein